MSDIWSETLHSCRFAGLELDCITAQDSIDRAVVRQSILHRQGGVIHDVGGMPRSTDCRLVFFERDALDEGDEESLTHLERLELFLNATQRGIAQEFVHPITGTYNAKVETVSFEVNGDSRDFVMVDCTFVEDAVDPDPFDVLQAPGSQGTAAVRVQAAVLETTLVELGIESDIPAEAIAAVEGWESPDISGRAIGLELQSLSDKVSAAQDEFELATDIDNYPAWEAFQNLNFELRNAARQYRQLSPTLFEHTFTAAVPLIVWTASVYGAANAQPKYDEIREINDIDDPLLIPAGTVIKAPPATDPGRQGLRSAPR
jgi:prophage DNA circulation protein